MEQISIIITDKRPQVEGTPIIVCGNSDYEIKFTFDKEWADAAAKTARFVYVQSGKVKHEDQVFTGDTVEVPVLENITQVRVGVFAGDLVTTTPAVIPCELSILCGSGVPKDPTPDQYSQIMALLQNAAQVDDTQATNTNPWSGEKTARELSKKANALRRTESGALVHVDDTEAGNVLALRVYGRSTQDGTPTPENPQEIVSVGDGGSATVAVCGKNLLNPNFTATVLNDNGIEKNGTYVKILKPGTYTVTTTEANNILFIGIADSLDASPNLYASDHQIMSTSRHFDAGQYLVIWGSSEASKLSTIMFCFGDNTEYEPYQAQTAVLTTSLPLRSIPVSSGGNVTIDGQQYIADTLEVYTDGSGKVVRRVEPFVPSGVSFMGYNNRAVKDLPSTVMTNADWQTPYGMCNLFKYESTVWADLLDDVGYCVAGNQFYFRFGSGSAVNSQATLDAWLAENQMTLFCPLVTPVESELTASEVQSVLALNMYAPVTNIYNSDGGMMSVEYVADVNMVVNRLIERIAALEAALVNS